MKALLLFILSVVLIVSCQKSIGYKESNLLYLKNVENDLKDSLQPKDFTNLDFSNAIITNPDSSISYLRIPFKEVDISHQFVLLKTDYDGHVFRGIIINLEKYESNGGSLIYNGAISISSLNRKNRFECEIIEGMISRPRSDASKLRVVPEDSHVLPDVIVTTYGSSGGEISYNSWMNITNLLGGGSGGSYSSIGSYGSSGGNGGGLAGSVGTPGSNGSGQYLDYEIIDKDKIKVDHQITVDYEFVEDLAPIDINKYLKCFSNIPDAGSKCSIEIFTDIPVDGHPETLLDWKTGSPGHTFLQFKKIGANETITQNIGFYPETGWKSIVANTPVASKFVDNTDHEFNASLKEELTPEQLKSVLTHLRDISPNLKYDIDDYNCTDFALEIFNYARISNPVLIPKYYILGPNFQGSSTPQGLYNKLTEMYNQNVERTNINIPRGKQYVSEGKGPCN